MKRNFRLQIFRLAAASVAIFMVAYSGSAFAQGPLHVATQWKIGGDTWWDYLALDPVSKLLYVTHGDHVVAIDPSTGIV